MTKQDRTPAKFGPYRVRERIGEGGMGVVYLATDAEQRPVAVKVLRPAVAGDPNARRRLAREVEMMRRVRSPFVAEVIDADVTCDPPYIVTRYVRGRTLEQVVTSSGPLRGQELAAVGRGLAAALAAVHAAGVVHRDLKPGNVMLSGGEPVVIDFGIAHSPDSTRITQTGMFMGTPGYLAPEVIEGKDSGQASDVHSWGATVAFAATGRPPFGSGTFETIFYRIVHGQPDLEGCPPPLLPLMTAALARDPARRPAAAELNKQVAALVPAALVPGPAPVTGPGAVPAGWPGLAGAAGLDGAAGVNGASGVDRASGLGMAAGVDGAAGLGGEAAAAAGAVAGMAGAAGGAGAAAAVNAAGAGAGAGVGAAGAAGGAAVVPPTIGDRIPAGQGNGVGGPPADAAVAGAVGQAAAALPGTALPGTAPPGTAPPGTAPGAAPGSGQPGAAPGAELPGNGVPAVAPPGSWRLAAGLSGSGQPGVAGAALPGPALPAPAPGWPHRTQPLAIGNPAGPSVGDLLPAVRYGPPGAGQAGALPPGDGSAAAGGFHGTAGRAAGLPARRRTRSLFVLAFVLVGVSASVIMPIAGTLAAVAAIMSLRAADMTDRRLARRRAARGARPADPAVTVLTYPVMLAWSVITGVLLAPLALVAAGIAAGITIVAVPVDPFPRAVAYAAGALVACYGLGPGSGGARRQLGKLFDAVGRSPTTALVALAGVFALAVAAVATAASQPAFYWPLHHLGLPSGNLHALRIVAHQVRIAFVRLAG